MGISEKMEDAKIAAVETNVSGLKQIEHSDIKLS